MFRHKLPFDIEYRSLNDFFSDLFDDPRWYISIEGKCDVSKYLLFINSVLISPVNDKIPIIIDNLQSKYFYEIRNRKNLQTQDSIITKVIFNLIQINAQNILTLAFKLKDDPAINHGMASLPAIFNTYPNTLKLILERVEWNFLLSIIGDFLMEYLLFNFQIFYPLPNYCYLQLTGIPVNVTSLQRTEKKNFDKITLPVFIFSNSIYKGSPFSHSHILNKFQPATKHMAKKFIVSIYNLNRNLKRIPRRLFRLVDSCQKLLSRHSRCPYLVLLRKYCPFPVFISGQNVNEYLLYYSSSYSVASFLRTVSHRILPFEILGSRYNWSIFNRLIYKFVSLRRFEAIYSCELALGMRLKDCIWLSPISRGQFCYKLLNQFLIWVFNDFFLPLLVSCFYCTDSEFFHHRILFYRRQLWDALTKDVLCGMDSFFDCLPRDAVEYIISNVNQKLPRSQKIGMSILRFYPKIKGLRPIINMSVPMKFSGYQFYSINRIIRPIYEVLSYERKKYPTFGSSVFGMNDIFVKYQSFLSQWKKVNCRPFIVSIDIRQFFNQLNRDKLLEFLKNFLSETEYLIQKYFILYQQRKQLIQKMKTHICSIEEYPSLEETVLSMIDQFYHAIFVDRVIYDFLDFQTILNTLKVHLTNTIARIGNRFYKQIYGIPQGSVISTLLACILLDKLEMEELIPSMNESFYSQIPKPNNLPLTLFLRQVDDFLFITSSESYAKLFLHYMKLGFPEYRVFINQDKTQTSFGGYSLDGKRISFISWCGLLVDTTTLEVKVDYSRFLLCPIRDQLTLDLFVNPGSIFSRKMKRFLSTRCNPLLLSPKINSFFTICYNIYQIFLFCAIKFICILKQYPSFLNNANFIIKSIILESIDYFFNLSCSSFSRMHCSFEINQESVRWLGLSAFIYITKFKKGIPFINNFLIKLIHILRLFESSSNSLKSNDILLQITSIDHDIFRKMKF